MLLKNFIIANNFDELKKTKKVTELKGTKFKGQYRLIIARKIKAIFGIEKEELILLILKVGRRKDIYR